MESRMPFLVGLMIAALAVAVLQADIWNSAAAPSNIVERAAVVGALPANLPQPTLSGRIPLKIDVPNLPPEQSRPWFDQFSWQSFIALNWPADGKHRGQPLEPDNPNILKNPPAGSITVWGSYKEAFELFGQGRQAPTPWDSYVIPNPPCEEANGRTKLLLMVNKGGTLLDGVNQALSFPLIDQFKNYAWTEVRFDQTQYEFIRNHRLYSVKILASSQPIVMPASHHPTTLGSIMLKATWRQMTNMDDKSRYYTVDAMLYDPSTQKCDSTLMGLVGFHIVHKLKQFPEWIWSSFEHVDNVERGSRAKPNTPISFNNGAPTPVTTGGWANRPRQKAPPLLPVGQRVPVQVTRFNPIPSTPPGASTRDLNGIYQALLRDTVWRNYQLVITQWPTNPASFMTKESGGIYPQDCGQPFPVDSCVNVALETYFQSKGDAAGAGGNSCMSCHYTAGKSDFSWVLQRRSH
jgi:hypothetical protein